MRFLLGAQVLLSGAQVLFHPKPFCLTLEAFHSLGPASTLQSPVLSPSVPPDCSLPLRHHLEARLPLPKTPQVSLQDLT